MRTGKTRIPADGARGFALIADLVGTVIDRPTDMSARKKHYLKATGYGTQRRGR
jgi:hypothetical protein